jgi:hypothetical protein
LTIENSLLAGNVATEDGSAISSSASTAFSDAMTITNTTITGNCNPGAGGPIRNTFSRITIRNSIIWNNTGSQIVNGYDFLTTVTYTITPGFELGTGNLNQDPLFVAPVAPASAPSIAGDYRLSAGSPAIDSASNSDATSIGSTDLAGNPRYADDTGLIDTGEGTAPIIDMGAYEFQGTSQPTADVNRDGIVSPTDAIYVINRLGTTDPTADVDGNGNVDTGDLNQVQNALGN